MRSHQTEQGIAQTYSLMTSLRAKGVPRKLAHITLAWAQLLAGTQQPVLSNVMTALPHLNPMKWLPSIRAFLCTIGSRIEVENLPATPLQCKHDQFLMDIALDLYSKLTDLQHLNACRLHLQVTLLSDITMANSKFIRSEIMQSHRALSNSAKELFPYQPSPDTAGWNIWQAFLLHLTRAPAYSLIQPLGRWLHPSHALLRKWQAYIDLSTNIVYLVTNTLESQSPLPLPIPFLLISTSQDDRSFDPDPHRISGLPQYHHPPCSMSIYNALISGSTTYSATPPSTRMCFASQKQSKAIHRSLLHLTDLFLLLSEPMAGSAPYLMASNLPPTMDLFLAVVHPPTAPKRMDSSLTSDSYTLLANTITPPYPRKLSSTLTPPV